MCTIFPETVDALVFAAIGRDAPYEVIHHDNLQSVLGLSGHDGTVLQTISYDPFGNITSQSSSNNNQLHYTGREQDPDAGLYNDRIRIYDPITGRFITEDTLGFKAGVNFYVYCQNNPVNHNDPYGEFMGWDDAVAAGGGATVGVIALGIHDIIKGNLSNWKDYAAAAAGGAAGGVVFNNSKNWVWAGAASAYVGNGTKQMLNQITSPNYKTSAGNLAYETAIGALTGGVGRYLTVEVQSIETELAQEVLSNPSIGATVQTFVQDNMNPLLKRSEDAINVATGTAGNLLSDTYDSIKETVGNTYNQLMGNSSSFVGDMSSNPAAGGYLIYPNMPNTNMMRSVYAK